MKLVMWRLPIGWREFPGRVGSLGGTFRAPSWPWLIGAIVQAKASHRITQDMLADPRMAYWRVA